MSDDQPDPPKPTIIHLGMMRAGDNGPGTYTGGVVKLSNDPEEELLATAHSFREAADRCLTGCKVVPDIEMLPVPGAVCAALACELYLKFIHLKESGYSRRGHDLLELYTNLGDLTWKALIELRPDIEEVLTRNRFHFTNARYHHELLQFSFRQQELLQLAEGLGVWIQARYKGPSDASQSGA